MVNGSRGSYASSIAVMLERLEPCSTGQESWNSTIVMLGVPETPEPPMRLEPRYTLLLRSPTVYETLGALNAFKRLGRLLTNRVGSSALSG